MASGDREAPSDDGGTGEGVAESRGGADVGPRLRQRLEQHFGSLDAVPDSLKALVADVASDYRRSVETELRFDALLNTATESLCWTTMDGSIVRINRAGARLLGYEDPEDLVGSERAVVCGGRVRGRRHFQHGRPARRWAGIEAGVHHPSPRRKRHVRGRGDIPDSRQGMAIRQVFSSSPGT